MKTSELEGPALNWAVAKCLVSEIADVRRLPNGEWVLDWWDTRYGDGRQTTPLAAYGTWEFGGPIIEKENISISGGPDIWLAVRNWVFGDAERDFYEGPTPLIAAMRCYVASKLGDEVEVPAELM